MTDEKPRYVTAVFCAYLASFSVGTAIGFSSPVLSKLEDEFPGIDVSNFGSLLTLGALFGSLLAGACIERFGRVGTILFSTLFSTGGWILILTRHSVVMLYLARFLLGISCGIHCMAIPVYISEVTPADRRGIYGAGNQFSIVLGIFVTYLLGMKDFLGVSALTLASFLPVVSSVATLVFMPESPTWLVKQDTPQAVVLESLRYFFGHTRFAEAQLQTLTEAQQKQPIDFTISDVAGPSVLRPLLIGFGLMFAQQCSGVNAIIFYTEPIFSSAGSRLEPSIEAIIVGGVQVAFTLPAALITDRAGRRVLLLTSSVIALIGMCLLILYYDLKQNYHASLVSSLTWLPATSLSIFIAGFSLGLGPIPWLLMSELLPTRARGVGTGLCVAFNSFCAFMVTKFFPMTVKSLGEAGTFAIFALIIVGSIIFIFISVPETKNKTLEEIEGYFSNQNPYNEFNASYSPDDNQSLGANSIQ